MKVLSFVIGGGCGGGEKGNVHTAREESFVTGNCWLATSNDDKEGREERNEKSSLLHLW